MKPVQKWALLGLHTAEGVEEFRHPSLEPSYASSNVGHATARRGNGGGAEVDPAGVVSFLRRRGFEGGTLVGRVGGVEGGRPWGWGERFVRVSLPGGASGGGWPRGAGRTGLGEGDRQRLPWS